MFSKTITTRSDTHVIVEVSTYRILGIPVARIERMVRF
jgi:hypothetical protein